ncbi:MAG: acyltransferase [Inquilinus limosus]|uniref:Acyltransferase n=1 Tax=Inquilinus limosus TaxID=171674 RepID=A0A952KDU4_9PROT|nr:acyltransferase [Inquilinus limosus]
MKDSEEIKPLTSSRGIAAFIVVLFHLQATINELCDRAILPLSFRTDHIGIISDGYIAVDFFFVLSGFIISRANGYLFEDSLRRADYGYFLTKRLGRLFALNVVTLVVLLPLEFLKYFTNVGNTPAFADTNTVAAWFENLFLVQTWFLGHGPSWNTVAWSISAEWAAYILYPILFVILVRCPAAVLTLVVGAAIAGLAWLESISPSGTLSLTDHGAVLRCLCGFTLGVITEHASHSQPVRRAAPWLGSGISISLAASAMVAVIVFGEADWMASPIFCAIVLALSVAGPGPTAVMSFTPVHLLGVWSFALYMTHFIVLRVYKVVAFWVFGHWPSSPALVIASLVFAVAVCIVVAWAAHRWIERPGYRAMRQLAERIRRSGPPSAPAPVPTAAV